MVSFCSRNRRNYGFVCFCNWSRYGVILCSSNGRH